MPTSLPAPTVRPDRVPELDTAATAELLTWVDAQRDAAEDPHDLARRLAPIMGAHPREDGSVAVGFWAPRLVRFHVADSDIALEILDPVGDLDITRARDTVRFRRTLVPVERRGELVFAVVRGVAIGTREQLGSFYALHFVQADSAPARILDPMAASLPFGACAPAEIYNLEVARRDRGDVEHWRRLAATAASDRCGPGIAKVGPVTNILQLHVPTATAGGTLASLTRWFEHLAEQVRTGAEPTPHERAFLGYDAVQLLPVEPTTVYEAGPPFWRDVPPTPTTPSETASTSPSSHLVGAPAAPDADGFVTVELRRPNTTNWGYDVVIAGSAAINPTLLETGRPNELIDLATVLHTFPGTPIQLIADVVYGHSDNQGLEVLDDEWFAGPNMYGQNLDYRNAWVRALLLEMQRRKVDYGFDGVRIDGAQDFRFYDASERELEHDDAFLQAMSDVVQEVAGCRYRPWMIFEDGRPWPEPDWELASTYRAVIDDQLDDDVFQWGPLTFAHNTPFVYGFWLRSWWRIREILDHGSTWISGCANHDTLRRGTQVSLELNINNRLGDTNLQILDKAYDNPAIKLLSYTALPGVPMDFINASMRAAWGFIRNQDDRYGVKILAEEAVSLDWQVDDEFYALATNFRRLKDLGFETLEELRRFMDLLPALVEVTDYDLETIAHLINDVEPPLAGPLPVDPAGLKTIARAWMDDMHDYANVTRWVSRLSPELTAYNLQVREFRRERPWLRDDLREGDVFDYLHPVEGRTVFACLRNSPVSDEQVLFVANMQGGPADLNPVELPLPGLTPEDWYLQIRTPDIGTDYLGGSVTLNDSAGLVFTR